MPSNSKELERVLDGFDIRHPKPSISRNTARKMLLRDLESLIQKEVVEAKEKRIKENRSLCGCPMCMHHTEAFALNQANKPKFEMFTDKGNAGRSKDIHKIDDQANKENK